MVGSALATHFRSRDHVVYAMSRDANSQLPFNWQPHLGIINYDVSIPIDVVINLSGENSKGRWTENKKAEILNSRVDATRLLSETLAALVNKPAVFISASAVGFYGDTGSREIDESAVGGSGFLADVAQQWEAACKPAVAAGIRTVNARFGVVLDPGGGALGEMLVPFRFCLGGKIGNGQQFWSWVSIDELVNMMGYVIKNDQLSGPVNFVSNKAVTNEEFTRILGKVLSRPTIFAMPGILARLLFGEMAEAMLLSSSRALPARLQTTGYPFIHPDLGSALVTILAASRSPVQ